MGDAVSYLEDNMPVEVVFYDGKAISGNCPPRSCKEIETEPRRQGRHLGKVSGPPA